ncbi:DUF6307 family protein [Mycobacteroides salmoniphilum]|uniref:DUF6307 family protein n=1 Tax=Mycobacteroides salmoniphilum TaxID=404941 RepID=UPI0010C29787|nr:DUF6307 family protein [Mycobacteroides salmoniphilum]QCH22591.1 hypothetical protein DSM43276_00833 [Mycobacteroides salmoniphilum]
MDSPATFTSPYEKRVELVKQALMSASSLDSSVAGELAVEVLRALNSIPEKVR